MIQRIIVVILVILAIKVAINWIKAKKPGCGGGKCGCGK